MRRRFSTPTSRPITIGDQYTSFKRALIPAVPVVDNIEVKKEEEKEHATESEKRVHFQEEEPATDGGPAEDHVDVTGDPASEESVEQPAAKKQRTGDDESTSTEAQGDEGSDSQDGAGCAAPVVHPEGAQGEPKDGDNGDGVCTEPEQDHAKPQPEGSSSSGEVQQ